MWSTQQRLAHTKCLITSAVLSLWPIQLLLLPLLWLLFWLLFRMEMTENSLWTFAFCHISIQNLSYSQIKVSTDCFIPLIDGEFFCNRELIPTTSAHYGKKNNASIIPIKKAKEGKMASRQSSKTKAIKNKNKNKDLHSFLDPPEKVLSI